MTDPITVTAAADTGLWGALGALLPGLSDADLNDLAAHAFARLEERVGHRLSTGLTDAQLAEFEKLIDAGDEDKCSEWLNRERPGYRKAVFLERVGVIVEVVRAMADDPQATMGPFRTARLFTPTLESVAELFDDEDIVSPAGADELVIRMNRLDDPDSQVSVSWKLVRKGPPRLTATSSITIAANEDCRSDLATRGRRWNLVRSAADACLTRHDDRLTVEMSGTIPVHAGITAEQLSSTVHLVGTSMLQGYDEVLGAHSACCAVMDEE